MKGFFWIAFFSIGFSVNAWTQGLPAIASNAGSYRVGQTVWYDLFTDNPAAAQTFYGNVFGWTFKAYQGKKPADVYTVIEHNGRMVGGIIPLGAQSKSAEWVGLISVENVADASAKAKAQGAVLELKPMDIGTRGQVAIIKDAQGAYLGMLRAAQGDPAYVQPQANDFLGLELWTNDQPASLAFYKSVLGFDHQDETRLGKNAKAFTVNGKPVAGCIPNAATGIRTHWVPYVRVANVAATVAKAKAAGAKNVYGPSADIRNNTAALLIDPAGAPIMIQQF